MSHAQQMDSVYKIQRHIYDLTRKYYLLGRDPVLKSLPIKPGEAMIEVGCGTARNLILAAHAFPEARLFGIDASEEMLKTAREKIEQAGLSHRIQVGFGYAETVDPQEVFNLDAPIEHYLFSYSLSMIPDWQGALTHASKIVAPGGQIHVVDFGDQAGWPGWFRNLLIEWLRRFHVTIRTEMPSYLAALADQVSGAVETKPLYRGYAMRASLIVPTGELASNSS